MKTLNRFRGPRISVDNDRCEIYGICVQQAPRLFQLDKDGRLRFRRQLTEEDFDQATSAARCCPMQAILLRGGVSDE
jgi:ferredoxin